MKALINWFRRGCPVPLWLWRKVRRDHAVKLREAASICHHNGEYETADALRKLAAQLEHDD